ncbi:MAG: hypothetical protein HC879_13480 [Leptolyngbyaceae cyanobacterium SL_5_9]|nr:hypothetical protein [Leptolyngbyaceae cyanobacterium SL_5_9]NJO74308.1 hypothetical protein [Leptolyngbyaceae cyanobacterium RM1_406_9]
MTTGPTRIDQLEALAQTILLAIDQLRQRQETFQQDLQASRAEFDQRLNANAEQIAANTAGLVELRSILADYLRSRTDAERRNP